MTTTTRSARRRRAGPRARSCSSSRPSRTCSGPPTCSCPSTNAPTASTAGFSLEVSPLLAYETQRTVAAAKALYARADRRNLFIKIPGTPEGLPAIEEVIASGVPVNVTSGASSSARCLLSRSSRSSRA
ncbi:transaldolase family protein [Streptomyces sp. NPDC056910]|uniref:transaldolase family protein n=1 Tax=Streptomyces sp. NPDC056910 TaxID=3345964 RepID=UPI003685DE80